jgi:hypothetical protein
MYRIVFFLIILIDHDLLKNHSIHLVVAHVHLLLQHYLDKHLVPIHPVVLSQCQKICQEHFATGLMEHAQYFLDFHVSFVLYNLNTKFN